MQYSRRSQRSQESSCSSPDCLRKTIFKKKGFSPSKARTENSPCLLLTWLTSFNKLIFYLSDEKQKIESVSPVFPLGCYPRIQQTFALCPAGREAKVPWATPITTGLRQHFTWWLAPVSDDNGLESAGCTKHKYPNNSFPGNKDWGVVGWHLLHPWAEDSECLKGNFEIFLYPQRTNNLIRWIRQIHIIPRTIQEHKWTSS